MTEDHIVTLVLAALVSIDKLTMAIAQAADEYQARKAARAAAVPGEPAK